MLWLRQSGGIRRQTSWSSDPQTNRTGTTWELQSNANVQPLPGLKMKSALWQSPRGEVMWKVNKLICSPICHPLRPRHRISWVWCATVSKIIKHMCLYSYFFYLAKANFIFRVISLLAASGSPFSAWDSLLSRISHSCEPSFTLTCGCQKHREFPVGAMRVCALALLLTSYKTLSKPLKPYLILRFLIHKGGTVVPAQPILQGYCEDQIR